MIRTLTNYLLTLSLLTLSLCIFITGSSFAQGLCVNGAGQISKTTPPIACNGRSRYYTSQGYEIYGYSSSGDSPLPVFAQPLRVRANANTSIQSGDTVYRSLNIDASGTLTVPSGTVIRVRGECTIAGTILVSGSARGGQRPDTLSGSSSQYAFAPAHPGLSSRASGFGTIGQSVDELSGGFGGIGIDLEQATQIRYPGLYGGGAGSAGSTEIGGAGGGSFILLCENRLRVNGSILADGIAAFGPGGGAGAGGIIVLASDSEVVLGAQSIVSASGGDGAPATANSAPGGGGGGGIIHIIAPTIRRSGTTDVSGGAGQAAGSGTVQNMLRSGGGGGGACGGNGGAGGNIDSDLNHTASGSGGAGHLIRTNVVPRYIFG